MGAETGQNGSLRYQGAVILLALVLAGVVYSFPLPHISEEGRRLTSVLVVVATLWVGEVLPLAVTAFLGPSFAVLVGAATAEQAFSAFGNPIMMLFVGSFLLARATFKHRLNERIAFRVLSLPILRNSPTRAFLFLGLTSAFLSAWMSNTAVTAMMLPIAQSVLLAMLPEEGRQVPRTYAAALMLIVAYAASVGGLFTPIGTPPNLIGIGLLEQATGVTVSFGDWVWRVFPVTAAALLLMMGYMAYLFRHERTALEYDRGQMVQRYAGLGRWKPVEVRVIAAFTLTVVLWLVPSLLGLASPAWGKVLQTRIPEPVVPLLVSGALFLLRSGDGDKPILELRDLARIDWPVIVLFGGGMCLGSMMIQSGMAKSLGEMLSAYVPGHDGFALVFVVCLVAIVVSETTSNTASANMVIPVVLAIATSIGADPVRLALAGTAACTFGFMLPVSTPTNALAYASGYVEQRQMIRWGIVLDVIGAVLLSLWFGLIST
jgi:solute carrier family 13 (sodium-dependent dicarboxylate transporter), member 2/3/5